MIHLPRPDGVELSDAEMQLRWGLQVGLLLLHTAGTECSGLQIGQGDRVDCKDSNGLWASAIITESSRLKARVHFTGYHTDFDEIVMRENLPVRLRPRGTMCIGSRDLVVPEGDVLKPERILNIRLSDEVEEYLVQWAGYSEDDCTWEHLPNLRDSRGCLPAIVIDYLKQPSVCSPRSP